MTDHDRITLGDQLRRVRVNYAELQAELLRVNAERDELAMELGAANAELRARQPHISAEQSAADTRSLQDQIQVRDQLHQSDSARIGELHQLLATKDRLISLLQAQSTHPNPPNGGGGGQEAVIGEQEKTIAEQDRRIQDLVAALDEIRRVIDDAGIVDAEIAEGEPVDTSNWPTIDAEEINR